MAYIDDLINSKLGDLIKFPSGEIFTIRGRIDLPISFHDVDSLIILGEVDLLIGVSKLDNEYLKIFSRVSEIDKNLDLRFEGATKYWAANLPSYSNAMGELLYRVLESRENFEMVILLYRGEEMIPFILNKKDGMALFSISKMPLTKDNNEKYPRYSSKVTREHVDNPVNEPEKINEKRKERTRNK